MVWIETQRLILRDFQPADVSELAPILNNPQVMEFSPTGILSASQTKEKIDSFINSYQAMGYGKWAVVYQETSELIGYCGISIEQIDDVDEREIGYRLAPQFWGIGLATEAASAAIQYGREQLRLPYIMGVAERKNKASIRILEKLGMKYQKETMFDGIMMDVYRLNLSASKFG